MKTLLHSLDWAGSILSFCSTLYFVRSDVKAWPFSMAAILINCFLYGWLGIYGDMSLEMMYFISTIYGWYIWLYGGQKHTEKKISHITWQHGLILTLFIFLGFYFLENFLHYDTNSKVPYLDAITTVVSLAAQWLTCRKIMESWVLWFAVDFVYMALFIYKGIPVHGVLHGVYVGMAVAGYWRWQHLMNQHNAKGVVALEGV